MLDIQDIKKYYTQKEAGNTKHLFREYLQYKILEALFSSNINNKISFLGGTSIRIIHNSSRFSEDLDFDNFNLSFEEFIASSVYIKRHLELDGFTVEIKNLRKGAYHCHVKFPELLYKNNLTPLKSEKILVQIDTMAHAFDYKPHKFLLNRFGILKNISTTPIDILLSQKIYAAFNRKRSKGRDFYDISYLLGFTKPNYEFLNYRLQIKEEKDLKNYIMDMSQNIDFKKLAKDVESFLLNPKDSERVLFFTELIKQVL